jgi:CelD/BcsL family acetyltransferase involved in cellulose biosynthesis
LTLAVTDFSRFDDFAAAHGDDWRRIAGASEAATVFQTWEWTAAWWRHYGRGRRFWGAVFSDDTGATVGCAALTLPPAGAPLRTALFAGTGGSDYLDIVAAPGREEAVAAAFWAHLAEKRRRWDWADLQQVRPRAVLLLACPPAGSGLTAEEWQGETCPYIGLPDTWEAFRKGLSKRLRQNVGYYERALEKQFGAVEYRLATAETLEADLAAFFDLHQRRWRLRWMPGAFASEQARAFHTDVARRLLESDRLRLHTLALEGKVRAALYCFQKGARCYYYLGGFDPELARLSAGTVLTARAIRHAIEADGAAEFDLLRGDEGYKYKWGAQDRFNRRVSVTRAGVLRPALLAAAGRASLRAEKAFKGWMHRRHGGQGASSGATSGKSED